MTRLARRNKSRSLNRLKRDGWRFIKWVFPDGNWIKYRIRKKPQAKESQQ